MGKQSVLFSCGVILTILKCVPFSTRAFLGLAAEEFYANEEQGTMNNTNTIVFCTRNSYSNLIIIMFFLFFRGSRR